MDYQWFDIERNADSWDAMVSHRGQSLFHLSPVIAVHRFGKSVRRGVVVASEKTVGLIGGLVRPTAKGEIFETLSFPGSSCGLDEKALSHMIPWLQNEGISEVRLGSFDGGAEDYPIDLPGTHVRERLEFLYDVSVDEEIRFSQANSNHRRKLKKAEKLDYRLTQISTREPLVMAKLHSVWAERKGERHKFRAWWHTFLYYHTLTRWLGKAGIGKLYGLVAGSEEILSVAYMLEYGTRSFYMIGASSEEGYRNGASVALFWQLARRYNEEGIKIMNLGCVPREAANPEHVENGVYRFKAGFGIEPTIRRSVTVEGHQS